MSLGVRHISRRRKSRLSGLPTRGSILKNALDLLIYPVAIAAPLALLPQVIQIYQTRDTGSLALPTWFILGSLNLVWLVYGLVHRDKPIMLTNLMLACMNFAVVVGIVLYS
jgi:MtN3 and saliva related transmembrane protein